MKNYTKREKQIIILLGIVVIIFLVSLLKNNFIKSEKSDPNQSEENLEKIIVKEDEIDSELEDEFKDNDIIYVHVCGRVLNPGLVELEKDSRVIDAVNKAGGLYDDADIDNINLAKKLSDEERVYIPKIGDVKEEITQQDNNNETIKKININTADENALKTLPGIGEKTAEKIIDYRQDKSFKEIDDIKNVPGIGDKKFEDLKDFIVVN